MNDPACRVCGCTDDDCTQCYLETGMPCHWVEEDLCSRCAANNATRSCEELQSA
jgi:hypothetical protein